MVVTRTFTSGADRFLITVPDTYDLFFLGGDDVLTIQAGTVTAHMGTGNDFARIDSSSATLYGEDGSDRFDINAERPLIFGGAGFDIFNIYKGIFLKLNGGDGGDRFNFINGALGAQVHGDAGDDLFLGNGKAISGTIWGDAGNDRFNDFVAIRTLEAFLRGGVGDDTYRLISTTSPISVIELAGEGTDTIEVIRGLNCTLGSNIENLSAVNSGTSTSGSALTGNSLNNRIRGSDRNDTLSGLDGNDTVSGGAGDDQIAGGNGDDRLNGGLGLDTIQSGAGRDVMIYTSVDESPGVYDGDFITDWNSMDLIDLTAIDANETIAGNQPFFFAGYSFGTPVTNKSPGALTIGGFGGELYIIGHTDGDGVADLVISLWSSAGESGLTSANILF